MKADNKNLRSIIGYAFVFSATVAILISPWLVSASTLKTNGASGVYLDYANNASGWWQGAGYGSDFRVATGTIAGFTVWTNGVSATTTKDFQGCLYDYTASTTLGLTAKQMFEHETYRLQGAGSCVASAKVRADENGFVNIILSSPYTINSTHYYAVYFAQTQNVAPYVADAVITKMVGFGYSQLDNLYRVDANTSPFYFQVDKAVYYMLFSGSPTVFTTFDPRTFLPTVATTTQAQNCTGNFATSSSILDSLGASVSYGFCVSFSYLFLPSTDSLEQFSNFTPTLQAKIPFSYVYELQTIFGGLSASTTANLSSVSYTLPAIGSTTPMGSFLPSTLTVLSTSTIAQYLPDNVRNSLLGLQRIALWLGFVLMMYRRIVPHHVMSTPT